jgi:DNA replication protein DnaC
MMKTADMQNTDLRVRLQRLGLFGLQACCKDISDKPWLSELLGIEEAERQRRSLDRRLRAARVGTFKTIADFDWNWPKRIDRPAVEELFNLSFIEDGLNVVLLGPNGVGKTMLLRNLAHHCLVRGHTVTRRQCQRHARRTCSPGQLDRACSPAPALRATEGVVRR